MFLGLGFGVRAFFTGFLGYSFGGAVLRFNGVWALFGFRLQRVLV